MSDVLELTKELIKRKSITPLDEGCQALIATRLEKAGFNIDFEKCINNKEIEDYVLNDRIEGKKNYKVNYTNPNVFRKHDIFF